jgi:hypothetical protein
MSKNVISDSQSAVNSVAGTSLFPFFHLYYYLTTLIKHRKSVSVKTNQPMQVLDE